MKESITQVKAKLLKDYYKFFSKYANGKAPEKKVAWVSSFAPVEILEALDIYYYYPESYAAVIAASGKEQKMLELSENHMMSKDCCSYSCCFEGCLESEEGPRGIPPKPDILVVANNQCNTLPNWWNILAERYNVPLVVLDYPGEVLDKQSAMEYVTFQHKELINTLEILSGKKLEIHELKNIINNSIQSISAWKQIVKCIFDYNIDVNVLFDDMSFLVTARCKPETSKLYKMIFEGIQGSGGNNRNNQIPIFWRGYPSWYHPKRYLSELLSDFYVCGSDYISYWNLEYVGDDFFEQLFSAYNYIFFNLTQETKDYKLKQIIKNSNARGIINIHNKSCKCDFTSARNVDLPQVEIEMDMIDREFLNANKAKDKIELLKELICTTSE